MTDARLLVFFDFVDPLSYLLARELAHVPGSEGAEWIPFELRPPPSPLVDVSHPELAERWVTARGLAASDGVEPLAFDPPALVPWTRKAHELLAHAPEDRRAELRNAVFEAYLLGGRDIGRVDVLVALGTDVGLDRTETKAVLDVDRYEAAVADARREGQRRGVELPPTVLLGEKRLQGFHNRMTLRTFLRTVAPNPDPNTSE